MLESDFGAQVVESLEGVGAVCFKIHGHGMQKSGWPDLQVYSPRWTGHIELKVGTELSTLQKVVMRDLWVRGMPAVVLRWISGGVQAEDDEMRVLGHIPPPAWKIRSSRGGMLVDLLNMGSKTLLDQGRLHPAIPPWQLDSTGKVLGRARVVKMSGLGESRKPPAIRVEPEDEDDV